jgi:ribokinase
MTTSTPQVCVVGSSNIDLFFRTARLPRPGETLAGQSFHLDYGGKGANQAVMAARFGARVTMVGKVGRDVFGEGVGRNFRQHGIDTTHLLLDDHRGTGVASICVDDEARNCILVVPGANLGLTPDDVRGASRPIQSADVLLCQLEVPVETVLEAFLIAKAGGVRTILNPAPAIPLPDELLALADLCVPNETEIEQLTGQPATTPAGAEAAARGLLRRGPGAVLVTLGERGALVVEGEAVATVAPVAVRAVDPSGAGDAFIGSLAVFLAEGLPLREAASRANAAAALSVTRPGTQASFPDRAELEAFLGPGKRGVASFPGERGA